MPRTSERAPVAHIQEELHKEVRIAATREGKTMRQFVIDALEAKVRARPHEPESEDAERRRREALERIWALFAHIPDDVSLVDELLAEAAKRRGARPRNDQSSAHCS